METASNDTSTESSAPKQFIALVCWVLLAFAASASGAFFMPGEWYADLNKPAFNPPGWIFGPVWTVLYVMMGVSAWLLWRRAGFASAAIKLWLVQLALNATWTPVFFGAHEMGWALVVIVAMWTAILATIVAAWRVAKPAALLFVPYLLWVSFATVLNATLWHLNPSA